MSIRSLADFNGSFPGAAVTGLTPPPSPPGPQPPGRHGERGMRTFNWPPARTTTTFSWPWTRGGLRLRAIGPYARQPQGTSFGPSERRRPQGTLAAHIHYACHPGLLSRNWAAFVAHKRHASWPEVQSDPKIFPRSTNLDRRPRRSAPLARHPLAPPAGRCKLGDGG